jgi:Flp pilus assembly pilin Flp
LTRIYSWYKNISSETVTVALPTRRPHAAGQGLAEYALILALIAIVAIIALIFLGGQVSEILSTVGKSI